MSEVWEGTGPMVAEPDRLLLEAKHAIPEPHPGGISRAELIEAARARSPVTPKMTTASERGCAIVIS